MRQYLEVRKGLTNIQVRKKFIKQLVGLSGMRVKPAYMLILDSEQGRHLINECRILGIQTISCGGTSLNNPTISYPLIGNFQGKEKRGAVLLLMYHAMFEGMRQEASIFMGRYRKNIKKYGRVDRALKQRRTKKKVKYDRNSVKKLQKKYKIRRKE
ncbi:hypothetical protein ACTFIU_000011 [Dictyostelium citrinum]